MTPKKKGRRAKGRKKVPTRAELRWPTLEVLKKAGGSASNHEISELVAGYLDLPESVSDILHGDGPQTVVDYRLGWARTDLKLVGVVDNKTRGIWTITPRGRAIRSVVELGKLYVKGDPQDGGKPPPSDGDWKERLLDILRGLKPDAFERLCQRVLRESGFTKVEVTGRSGDGGIDGAGVLRVKLISFHVRFQCKRYKGSVQPSAIRDFRGALAGRADKGLFMTTGRFTSGARQEAVRDGALAIDLIDGLDLCKLLKELELGVSTEVVESTRPLPEFFAEL